MAREYELAELAAAATAARQGRTRVLTVVGPAGSGRSALLDAAARIADGHGLRVLRAAGLRDPDAPPFTVARALLRSTTGRGGADDLLPAQLRDGGRTGAGPDLATVHGAHGYALGLLEDAPTALLVDDADLADTATQLWLARLARHPDDVPLLLVLALSAGPDRSAGDAAGDLRTVQVSRSLRPAALSRDGVREMLRHRAGGPVTPGVAAVCHGLTCGNPGLVGVVAARIAAAGDLARRDGDEVRRLAAGPVDAAIRAVLLRLPGELVELATAAAVLDEDASPATCASVAGLDEAGAQRAADGLALCGVLDPRTWRIPRPLVREQMLRCRSATRIAQVHARAARAVDASGGELDRVAEHLLRAGPPADAGVVELLHAAGCLADRRGASEQAVRYLRHAARGLVAGSPKHVDVLLDLGRAERAVDPAAALIHLDEAHRRNGSVHGRARTLLELVPLLTSSRPASLFDRLEAVLAELDAVEQDAAPDPDAVAELTRLRMRLRVVAVYSALEDASRIGRVWDWVDRTDRDRSAEGPEADALRSTHVFLSALGSRAGAAETLTGVGPVLDGDLADDELLQPVRMGALGLLGWTEAEAELAGAIERSLNAARARHWRRPEAFLLGVRSLAKLRRGHLPEAAADADASLAELDPRVAGEARWMVVYSAAVCAVERGDLDRAEELLATVEVTGDAPTSWRWNWVLTARGAVLAARGRCDLARDVLVRVQDRMWSAGLTNPVALDWPGRLARVHHRLGEREAALAVAGESLELALRWGTPGAIGSARHIFGVVSGGPEAIPVLRAALAELDRSPRVLDRARCATDLGIRLGEAGAVADARDSLRTGVELATDCGAEVLAGAGRSALVALGGRPRRTQGERLTPSELQVARLAADGHGNRGIAEMLQVSRRTVELHLTRCYRALGIAGRSELAAALSRRDAAVEDGAGRPVRIVR